MNLIIFFIVTAACIFYLSLPYFRKNSGSLIDLDNLSELRKEKVLQELNNELENGTITIEQFNKHLEEFSKTKYTLVFLNSSTMINWSNIVYDYFLKNS